ncbi:MAG TPA: hypothetical protein VF395_13805 [Polyangiaceae bacterium]
MALALLAGCTNGEAGRLQPELGKRGDPAASGLVGTGGRPAQTSEGGLGAKVPGVAESTGATCADAAATHTTAASRAGQCADPRLGVVGRFVPEIATLTGTAVNGCMAGNTLPCSGGGSTFMDPADVGLDYGDFPFSREQSGEYFFAVMASGYEGSGFLEGAVGNLSDAVPSSVEGDRGSGDTLAARTIVVSADQVVTRFPASSGSHKISVPPSGFVTIHLAPFDTTPAGSYTLAVCRMGATSRCDCAFDTFTVVHRPADAGTGGSEAADASAGGAGGAASAGGASADAGPCNDMCTPGATQCAGCGVQTCDATGTWGTIVECGGATPVCIAGACVQPR